MAQNESAHQSNQAPQLNKTPLFFRDENAGFIARGNFMTLALKPQLVEEGEWLAHQSKHCFIILVVQSLPY
jgi:MOB kinase activator 1